MKLRKSAVPIWRQATNMTDILGEDKKLDIEYGADIFDLKAQAPERATKSQSDLSNTVTVLLQERSRNE